MFSCSKNSPIGKNNFREPREVRFPYLANIFPSVAPGPAKWPDLNRGTAKNDE